MSLSAQKKLAACHLALGRTNAETANALGISERQLYRWQEQSDFMAEVTAVEEQLRLKISQGIDESGDVVASAIVRSSRLLDKAVDVLENALQSDDVKLRDKLETIKILSGWHGLNSDFNVAVATLRRYGLALSKGHYGDWQLRDVSAIGGDDEPEE